MKLIAPLLSSGIYSLVLQMWSCNLSFIVYGGRLGSWSYLLKIATVPYSAIVNSFQVPKQWRLSIFFFSTILEKIYLLMHDKSWVSPLTMVPLAKGPFRQYWKFMLCLVDAYLPLEPTEYHGREPIWPKI